MIFSTTPLPGVYLIQPEPFQDNRGWFMRTYDQTQFAEIGHTEPWVQLNHSLTRQPGAIRGLHFQHPPYAEIKLIRCVAGRVFDVAVDLRADSPTFLQWVGVELSAQNQQMLYVPKGVAHGFQTLEADCQLIYCHSTAYTSAAEGGIRYNDPRIGISWPLPVTDLSARDANHALLTHDFKGIRL